MSTTKGKLTSPIVVGGTLLPLNECNVVLLGANGSGKTTVGCEVVGANGARRISARRALTIGDSIPMQQVTTATQEYRQKNKTSQSSRTELVTDFQHVLARLLAEETEQARRLREQVVRGERVQFAPADATSTIDVVRQIWEPLFPGRTLGFKDHAPTVVSAGKSYKQQELSDGEIQALYLIAKVAVEAQNHALIVVDEPEIHLHSALARSLWDAIEDQFDATRVLYITHDIGFALSRQDARIAVVRSPKSVELLPPASGVPNDVVMQIVGAVTAGAKTDGIVYCEGGASSPDIALFEALYRHNAVRIVPVGSCDSVVACVRHSGAVMATPAAVFGFVDRDERCEDEIRSLREQGICVLPVPEVEQLYALSEVAEIVATAILKETETEAKDAVQRAFRQFAEERRPLAHVHATKYAVDELRWRSLFPKQTVSPGTSGEAARANIVAAWSSNVALDPAGIYSAALARLAAALDAGPAAVLTVFSGKSVVEHVAKALGIATKRYRKLVVDGLRGLHGNDVERRLRSVYVGALLGAPEPINPTATAQANQ